MIIGLIGGSGSGKSAVADLLKEDFGAFVITADKIGHQILEKGTESYERLIDYFGHEILDQEGNIDRGKLGQKAFLTEENRQALNQMTRPYIGDEIQRMIAEETKKDPNVFIVVDAEGLVEANMTYFLDEVWSVYAPLQVRRERLLEKRGFTEEKFESIINMQNKDEYYRKHSNFEIVNDSTLDHIREQLRKRLGFGGK